MISLQNTTPTGRLMLLGHLSGGIKTDEVTTFGNPLTFQTDLARPLKSLLIPFTPQQEGTGDPSPSNIRSILPWNGLTVFGGGKNLFDKAYLSDENNYTIYFNDYWYTEEITLKANTTYSLTPTSTEQLDTNRYYVLKINTFSGYSFVYPVTAGRPSNIRFTTGDKGTIQFGIYKGSLSYFMSVDWQLEVGQTATAYEPYYPITETDIVFPSPVYGGEHEAVSGKLLNGWKAQTFDGSSDEVWYFVRVGTSDYYRAYINMPDAKQPNNVAVFADSYKAVSFDNRSFSSKVCFMGNENETPVIFALITDLTTIESFTSYLAENPLTIVYQLATPTEQTLTGHQITALIGNNTIWSDADRGMTAVYLRKR